jgi:hypothetical protein
MSTPGDHIQEPNMEGQKTVALMVAHPHLESKKIEDDPVVAPVVSGLSAIGVEPGTEEIPDMAPVVAPPPQVISTQQMNPKQLMWTPAKPLFLLNMAAATAAMVTRTPTLAAAETSYTFYISLLFQLFSFHPFESLLKYRQDQCTYFFGSERIAKAGPGFDLLLHCRREEVAWIAHCVL